MSYTVANDPGLKGMAWALADDNRQVIHCAIVPRPSTAHFVQPDPDEVARAAIHSFARETGWATVTARPDLAGVGERMVVYPVVTPATPRPTSRRLAEWTKKANDLLLLQASSSQFLGALCGGAVTYLRPAEWKGQRPKEWTQVQVLAALSETEKKALKFERYPISKLHNLFDVVGILLTHLGRIR